MGCFWVRDNGPGLSREAQMALFTPFTRLEQVHAKGYGLGLSIVQRVVERLGGEVGVESELGRGSKFFFTLPVAPNEKQIRTIDPSEVKKYKPALRALLYIAGGPGAGRSRG